MDAKKKAKKNVERKKAVRQGVRKKASPREVQNVTNTLKGNFSRVAELSALIPIGSDAGFQLVASAKKLERYVNQVADTVAASEGVTPERLEALSVVTDRISGLVTSLDTVLILRSDTLHSGATETDVFNGLSALPEETILKIAKLGVPLRELSMSQVLALNVTAEIVFGPFTELLELLKAIFKEIKAALIIALVICILIAPELIPIIVELLVTLELFDEILDWGSSSPPSGALGPGVTAVITHTLNHCELFQYYVPTGKSIRISTPKSAGGNVGVGTRTSGGELVPDTVVPPGGNSGWLDGPEMYILHYTANSGSGTVDVTIRERQR